MQGRVYRSFLEILLTALGWKYANEGKKAKPFADAFTVLGAEIDLKDSSKGTIIVRNKESRIESIMLHLNTTLDKSRITAPEAASLQGQLNFAQQMMYGNGLKPVMAFLSEMASSGWKSHLEPMLGAVAGFTASMLRNSPPRVVSISDIEKPVLCYTDGTYELDPEPPQLGCGTYLLDEVTGVEFSREIVPPNHHEFRTVPHTGDVAALRREVRWEKVDIHD